MPSKGNAGAIRAGRAYVEVYADDTMLDRGLKLAEQRVKQFGITIGKIGLGLSGIGALITAPITMAIHKFAEGGSQLLVLSERTGMSVEALSRLRYMADQTGSNIDEFEVAIRRMQKSLVAGFLQGGEAAESFALIGLSVRKLIRLSPEQQFDAITKRLAMMKNESVRSAESMSIFGRSGTVVLPMIRNLKELNRQFTEFDLEVSTESAKTAHRLEQSYNAFKKTLDKIITTIGSSLAPMFEQWNTTLGKVNVGIKNIIKKNSELIPQIFKVAVGVGLAGTAFVELGAAVWIVGKAIGIVTTLIRVLRTTLVATVAIFQTVISLTKIWAAIVFMLESPLVLFIGAMGVAGTVLFAFTNIGQRTLKALGGALMTLKDDAIAAFGGISDALKAGELELAVKILWTALKVEWYKGKLFLEDSMASLKDSFFKAFADAKDNALGVLKDLWSELKTGFSDAFAVIKDYLSVFTGDLKSSLIDIKEVLSTSIASMMAMAKHEDPTEKIKEIADAAAKARMDLQKELVIEKNLPNRPVAPNFMDIIGPELHAPPNEPAALPKPPPKPKEKSETQLALEELQQELKDLMETAADLAAKTGTKKPKEIGKGFGDLNLDMARTRKTVDVQGTFSAAAIKGLGAGTTIDKEQLKEQKRTTEELRKLNKKQNVGANFFLD